MSTRSPLLDTVAAVREWRQRARDHRNSVGFVPTMGALHDGHISLVRRSLAENDLTVVSIFVNPAQFAPHEDLATYPRTLASDLHLLAAGTNAEHPPVVFIPPVHEIYPSGITLDVALQTGTFVEVKGYGHQMEGKCRPTFFRGVATVVLKLFNVVEPTRAYFGQKDIQQALLLRRLCKDLLLSHPDPEHLVIVPTARDPTDNLALSSRNVYLTPADRKVAGTLNFALRAAEQAWGDGLTKHESVNKALDVVATAKAAAAQTGVEITLEYIEMNDPETFDVLDTDTTLRDRDPVILSGAIRVGNTRLIDNLILGDATHILT